LNGGDAFWVAEAYWGHRCASRQNGIAFAIAVRFELDPHKKRERVWRRPVINLSVFSHNMAICQDSTRGYEQSQDPNRNVDSSLADTLNCTVTRPLRSEPTACFTMRRALCFFGGVLVHKAARDASFTYRASRLTSTKKATPQLHSLVVILPCRHLRHFLGCDDAFEVSGRHQLPLSFQMKRYKRDDALRSVQYLPHNHSNQPTHHLSVLYRLSFPFLMHISTELSKHV
jgi:hypothetical protein